MATSTRRGGRRRTRTIDAVSTPKGISSGGSSRSKADRLPSSFGLSKTPDAGPVKGEDVPRFDSLASMGSISQSTSVESLSVSSSRHNSNGGGIGSSSASSSTVPLRSAVPRRKRAESLGLQTTGRLGMTGGRGTGAGGTGLGLFDTLGGFVPVVSDRTGIGVMPMSEIPGLSSMLPLDAISGSPDTTLGSLSAASSLPVTAAVVDVGSAGGAATAVAGISTGTASQSVGISSSTQSPGSESSSSHLYTVQSGVVGGRHCLSEMNTLLSLRSVEVRKSKKTGRLTPLDEECADEWAVAVASAQDWSPLSDLSPSDSRAMRPRPGAFCELFSVKKVSRLFVNRIYESFFDFVYKQQLQELSQTTSMESRSTRKSSASGGAGLTRTKSFRGRISPEMVCRLIEQKMIVPSLQEMSKLSSDITGTTERSDWMNDFSVIKILTVMSKHIFGERYASLLRSRNAAAGIHTDNMEDSEDDSRAMDSSLSDEESDTPDKPARKTALDLRPLILTTALKRNELGDLLRSLALYQFWFAYSSIPSAEEEQSSSLSTSMMITSKPTGFLPSSKDVGFDTPPVSMNGFGLSRRTPASGAKSTGFVLEKRAVSAVRHRDSLSAGGLASGLLCSFEVFFEAVFPFVCSRFDSEMTAGYGGHRSKKKKKKKRKHKDGSIADGVYYEAPMPRLEVGEEFLTFLMKDMSTSDISAQNLELKRFLTVATTPRRDGGTGPGSTRAGVGTGFAAAGVGKLTVDGGVDGILMRPPIDDGDSTATGGGTTSGGDAAYSSSGAHSTPLGHSRKRSVSFTGDRISKAKQLRSQQRRPIETQHLSKTPVGTIPLSPMQMTKPSMDQAPKSIKMVAFERMTSPSPPTSSRVSFEERMKKKRMKKRFKDVAGELVSLPELLRGDTAMARLSDEQRGYEQVIGELFDFILLREGDITVGLIPSQLVVNLLTSSSLNLSVLASVWDLSKSDSESPDFMNKVEFITSLTLVFFIQQGLTVDDAFEHISALHGVETPGPPRAPPELDPGVADLLPMVMVDSSFLDFMVHQSRSQHTSVVHADSDGDADLDDEREEIAKIGIFVDSMDPRAEDDESGLLNALKPIAVSGTPVGVFSGDDTDDTDLVTNHLDRPGRKKAKTGRLTFDEIEALMSPTAKQRIDDIIDRGMLAVATGDDSYFEDRGRAASAAESYAPSEMSERSDPDRHEAGEIHAMGAVDEDTEVDFIDLELPQLTNEQKKSYLGFFFKLDRRKRGYVAGPTVKKFFLKSKVAENCLAIIWELCDTKETGSLDENEFCVAMHLINCVRTGQVTTAELNTCQHLPLHLAEHIHVRDRDVTPASDASPMPDTSDDVPIRLDKHVKSAEKSRKASRGNGSVPVKKRGLESPDFRPSEIPGFKHSKSQDHTPTSDLLKGKTERSKSPKYRRVFSDEQDYQGERDRQSRDESRTKHDSHKHHHHSHHHHSEAPEWRREESAPAPYTGPIDYSQYHRSQDSSTMDKDASSAVAAKTGGPSASTMTGFDSYASSYASRYGRTKRGSKTPHPTSLYGSAFPETDRKGVGSGGGYGSAVSSRRRSSLQYDSDGRGGGLPLKSRVMKGGIGSGVGRKESEDSLSPIEPDSRIRRYSRGSDRPVVRFAGSEQKGKVMRGAKTPAAGDIRYGYADLDRKRKEGSPPEYRSRYDASRAGYESGSSRPGSTKRAPKRKSMFVSSTRTRESTPDDMGLISRFGRRVGGGHKSMHSAEDYRYTEELYSTRMLGGGVGTTTSGYTGHSRSRYDDYTRDRDASGSSASGSSSRFYPESTASQTRVREPSPARQHWRKTSAPPRRKTYSADSTPMLDGRIGPLALEPYLTDARGVGDESDSLMATSSAVIPVTSPSTSHFVQHMTKMQAKRLRIGDEVDFRDLNGKFRLAEVCDIDGTELELQFMDRLRSPVFDTVTKRFVAMSLDTPKPFNSWCDYTEDLYRLAIKESIRLRPVTRKSMKPHCIVGRYIDFYDSIYNECWVRAQIVDIDCGQVCVVFDGRSSYSVLDSPLHSGPGLITGEQRWSWVHLDDSSLCAPPDSRTKRGYASGTGAPKMLPLISARGEADKSMDFMDESDESMDESSHVSDSLSKSRKRVKFTPDTKEGSPYSIEEPRAIIGSASQYRHRSSSTSKFQVEFVRRKSVTISLKDDGSMDVGIADPSSRHYASATASASHSRLRETGSAILERARKKRQSMSATRASKFQSKRL